MQTKQNLSSPTFVQMETESRSTSGDGAAHVDKIAIAIGTGANDRIGKNNRIGFTPGDLIAETRPEPRLIWSACERGFATQMKVSFHQPLCSGLLRSFRTDQFGMDQVHGTDIQRRGDAHTTAIPDQPLDKIQIDL